MSTAGASGEKWATRTVAAEPWAPAATGRASRLAAHSARTRPARRDSERGTWGLPSGWLGAICTCRPGSWELAPGCRKPRRHPPRRRGMELQAMTDLGTRLAGGDTRAVEDM